MIINAQRKFKAQFMTQLSNTENELKKSIAYKKKRDDLCLYIKRKDNRNLLYRKLYLSLSVLIINKFRLTFRSSPSCERFLLFENCTGGKSKSSSSVYSTVLSNNVATKN